MYDIALVDLDLNRITSDHAGDIDMMFSWHIQIPGICLREHARIVCPRAVEPVLLVCIRAWGRNGRQTGRWLLAGTQYDLLLTGLNVFALGTVDTPPIDPTPAQVHLAEALAELINHHFASLAGSAAFAQVQSTALLGLFEVDTNARYDYIWADGSSESQDWYRP